MLTAEQKLKITELKRGSSTIIGKVTVKRDTRGRITVVRGDVVKSFDGNNIQEVYSKVNELNNVGKDHLPEIGARYSIPGTSLIVVPTATGYELHEYGKRLQKDLTQEQLDEYVAAYRAEKSQKKVEETRKEIKKEAALSAKKRVLYYFILVLSVVILGTVYVLGIKTDGVTFKRENQDLYEVISDISRIRHPEKKFDKFDEVYFTLNYYLHQNNYFLQDTEWELKNPYNDEIYTIIVPSVKSWIYYNPTALGATTPEEVDLSHDFSYSGVEFNAYFRDDIGRYVDSQVIYSRLVRLFGPEVLTDVFKDQVFESYTKIEELLTPENIAQMYALWDKNDAKSNVAYNVTAVTSSGQRPFDVRVDYFETYLNRNPFIQLFLNPSAKFINDYSLFFSAGWTNWVALAIFFLYLILWFSIWLFKKDNLKMSRPLTVILIVLASAIIIPLVLQYIFEGLSKEANQFLEVIENTKFTTTSTMMNFIFDWIMRLANYGLVGIVTIALPLKIVRYFVLNKIKKLDKNGKITRMIAPDMVLTEDIDPQYSFGR